MPVEKLGEWNFEKVLKAFELLKSNDLPLLIGKEAQNHFLEGFKTGGGQTDAGKWAERTTKNKSDKKNPSKTRALLVESGTLRRSVKLLEYKFDRIVIGTKGIKYAARHNEGITDSKGRPMPKREFIGKSSSLDRKIISLLRNKLDNIWNK